MYYYVYMASNKEESIFYVGITTNLGSRMITHRIDNTYICKKKQIRYLMYIEVCLSNIEATKRRKTLHQMNIKAKKSLIQRTNPHHEDLLEREGKLLSV